MPGTIRLAANWVVEDAGGGSLVCVRLTRSQRSELLRHHPAELLQHQSLAAFGSAFLFLQTPSPVSLQNDWREQCSECQQGAGEDLRFREILPGGFYPAAVPPVKVYENF